MSNIEKDKANNRKSSTKSTQRRRKKGEGSWSKKTINGIQYHHFRKEYDGIKKDFYGRTVSEVKEKISKFESKTNNIVQKEISKQTLYDYMFNWLNNQKAPTVRKQTLDISYKAMKYQLKPFSVADMQMGDLNSTSLQEHFNELAKQYSKSTIDKLYNPMSQCLTYAKTKGDISNNPMETVIRPTESAVSVKKKEIQFLEPEDMDLLFQEASRKNVKGFCITGQEGTPVYSQYAWLIILILYTGLRIGEALALQWKNVDLEKKEIRVDKTAVTIINKDYDSEDAEDTNTNFKSIIDTPKTKSGTRSIPLVERAIISLKELEKYNPNHEASDFVCLSSTNNMPTKSNITRTLHSMLKRAGTKVEKCGLHSLRHSYASLMILSGVDIKIVSQILGHADVSITYNTYVHIIDRQRIRAADTINQFIKLNATIEDLKHKEEDLDELKS